MPPSRSALTPRHSPSAGPEKKKIRALAADLTKDAPRYASGAAVVMCSFGNAELAEIAAWATRSRVGMHIHVSDAQLRGVLSEDQPVHFELPQGVRSMSLEDGFFRSGYQLYRHPPMREHIKPRIHACT